MIRALTRGASASLLFAVLSAGAAFAQAPEEEAAASPEPPATTGDAIILLAPEEVRAEWTAALQVELAPAGEQVIPAEPVEGATILLRDAAAQALAIESGARAAARVEGATLRVIPVDADHARATPFAPRADARTIALILVSLLDERDALGPVPPPPPVPAPAAPAAAPPASLAHTTPPSTPEATPDDDEDPEESESPWPQFSGRIGTGGFGLINDRRFIGGGMIRGGMGLRARYFEGAVLIDAAMMLDSLSNAGSAIQPLGRACLEAGAAIPAGQSLAFHVGGRGCGGFAQLRVIETFPSVPGTPSSSFTFDQMGWLLSVGGYVGTSFALSGSSRLYIRADVAAATLEASMHAGEVFATLSTIFSFY